MARLWQARVVLISCCAIITYILVCKYQPGKETGGKRSEPRRLDSAPADSGSRGFLGHPPHSRPLGHQGALRHDAPGKQVGSSGVGGSFIKQILPVYGFGIFLYVLYILLKVANRKNLPVPNKLQNSEGNAQRKITDRQLEELEWKLTETEAALCSLTSKLSPLADRIGGSALEQQEMVVEHLRQLRTVVNGTRVVSEGDDLDQVAQESLQDEFKGDAAESDKPLMEQCEDGNVSAYDCALDQNGSSGHDDGCLMPQGFCVGEGWFEDGKVCNCGGDVGNEDREEQGNGVAHWDACKCTKSLLRKRVVPTNEV
uniref:Resistance to inhibitors of cholinesterase protein 3 N-terminal domain-containing protein n=1 Tax=Eptatretus burgeri TaxID=7764 RepID=A0A8C4X2H6_EPTBU